MLMPKLIRVMVTPGVQMSEARTVKRRESWTAAWRMEILLYVQFLESR
jgi:hypothetical protein